MMKLIEGKDGRWYKKCPSCGRSQSYGRKDHAKAAYKNNLICKTCSNRQTDNCHRGWHRGVRISWFNKFKLSALMRNLEFDIDIDHVADLLDKCNGKCALSGLDISFYEGQSIQEINASIDRIDSGVGYIEGNVQLVHKYINMMKQSYTQKEFVSLCESVVNTAKKSSEVEGD